MRTKVKFLDPLTVSAIFLVFSLFLGIASIKTGNYKYVFILFISIIIFAYLFYIAKNTPGLVLENDFDGKIRYKSEDDCEPQELKELPAKVDGINTGIKPGMVFKVRSGTNVYIDKTGNVRSYSPVSAWVNKWLSRNDFAAEELKCWEKLF